MTRVSLKEAYDNKDVVAQIFAIKDTANGAEATANTANTTANEAKTHVDTVAVDVERAVVTANNASASAQESARVVAGYDARLTTAEDGVVRNRSDILTIDGEITDIYNDLTNVVRKVGDTEQIVYSGLDLRGTNRTPHTPVGQLNNLIVNAKRLIEEIDAKLNAYVPMVRTTDNQIIDGEKTFRVPIKGDLVRIGREISIGTTDAIGWYMAFDIDTPTTYNEITVDLVLYAGYWNQPENNTLSHAIVKLTSSGGSITYFTRDATSGLIDTAVPANGLAMVHDADGWHLMVNCAVRYCHYQLNVNRAFRFGSTDGTSVFVKVNNDSTKYPEPTTASWETVIRSKDKL